MACSRLPATSCSTATSPSTTRRACGASGESSTRCSPIWLRCRTVDAGRFHRGRHVGRAHRQDDAERHRHHQGQPGRMDHAADPAAGHRHRRPGCRRCGTGPSTTPNPDAPVYLGEPEPTTAETPNFTEGVPGHFGSRPGDVFVGDRPVILFNPFTGRPAFPMLRPHLERRPPFAAEPALRCAGAR